jgi:hypothetical protein
MTASARVTPRTKETRYSARVEADLTTRVEVYKGVAAVEAQGSVVDVPAGMQTRVAPGLAPEVARKLENAPELEARAQEFRAAVAVGGGAATGLRPTAASAEIAGDAASLRGDIESLKIGVPVLGFHVQAAADQAFTNVLFDRKYDSDERFAPADAGLAPGAYWWRIALVDLLGVEAPFSEPRHYTVGLRRAARAANAELADSLTIIAPVENAEVTSDKVRIVGVLRDDALRLEVAGKPVRIDADGNFLADVPVSGGPNEIELVLSDGKGNQTRLFRHVTRR